MASATQRVVRWAPSHPSADEQDGLGADLPAPEDERTASTAPDMAIPASPSDHQPDEPSLVRRCDLYPDAAWLPLPRGDHGLVQPKGSGVETIEYDGCWLLCHGVRGGNRPLRQARDLQHGSRLAVHELCVHEHFEGCRHSHLDGRPWPLDGQCLHRAAVAIAEI